MSRVIALVIKDIKLYARNPLMPLVLFLTPLLLVGLSAWMMNSASLSPQVIVDNRLSADFNGQEILKVTAAGGENKIINLQYVDSAIAKAAETNRKIALLWRLEGTNRVLTVLTGNSHSKEALELMERYLRPMPEANYRLERTPIKPSELWIMLMGVLIIMGCVTLGATNLSSEVENRNILALRKSGFSDSLIFLSKITFVTITQTILFWLFCLLCAILHLLPVPLSIIWCAPIVAVISSLTGIFLAAVTPKRELLSLGLMILTLPAIIYSQIADQVSFFMKFILMILPTTQATAFVVAVFHSDNLVTYIILIVITTIIVFLLSLHLFKRTTQKYV